MKINSKCSVKTAGMYLKLYPCYPMRTTAQTALIYENEVIKRAFVYFELLSKYAQTTKT